MPDIPKSSYLRHLPPVLWEDEPPNGFTLGSFLQIFEKILTGIDDGVPLPHGEHEHEPIEQVIARLYRLFDPWTTPPEFLPYLAGWLALEFLDVWTEYQRRKITADIVDVYRKRGLKPGLMKLFELHATQKSRGIRIVVDDGARVLWCTPAPARRSEVVPLITQGPFLRPGEKEFHHEGLIAPTALARGPDGSVFVTDLGTSNMWPVVTPGVYRITPLGMYAFSGAPPKPQRLGSKKWELKSPCAVVTGKANPNGTYHLYVLDGKNDVDSKRLYQLASSDFSNQAELIKIEPLGNPVAMAFDLNGHLLILDRGAEHGTKAKPGIIAFDLTSNDRIETKLASVEEPLSLLVHSSGDLVIGDMRDPKNAEPADLVRVDRKTDPWTEIRLLSNLAAETNPLAAPTSIVEASPERLHVLDAGLKPMHPDPQSPYVRQVVQPAAIYEIDISMNNGISVARVTEPGAMVLPVGMVLDGDTLLIADQGERADEKSAGFSREWRALPDEIGIIVHFSKEYPAPKRKKVVQSVRDVVKRERPAHTYCSVVSELP